MNHSYWLIVIFVASLVCNANSRPQDEYGKNYYRVYRPLNDADQSRDAHVAATSGAIPGIEAIAVVARASSDHPSPETPTVIAPHTVDMVDGDTRTPPKLKEIIQGKISGDGRKTGSGVKDNSEREAVMDRIEANGRFELPDVNERSSSMSYISEGKASQSKKKEEDMGVKGIAVPVLMDDGEPESAVAPPKVQKISDVGKPGKEDKTKNNGKPMRDNVTTTPSSGLSTWILLSDNRESTTVPARKASGGIKKESPVKLAGTTTKKTVKVQMTTPKPVREIKTEVPKTTVVFKKGQGTQKPDNRKPEAENMSALEAMVKGQKKNPSTSSTSKIGDETLAYVTKLPVQKKTSAASKPSRINDRMDAAETKDKAEIDITGRRPSTVPTMLPVATQNPTTLTVADQHTSGQGTTDPSVEVTTKKKKSGNKKKKKNKNRRRKPSNGNETQIEQKNVAKNPKQPVSAQFYNFLSREIMPTVGLGLVGVLVTAGLAGLLGYNPFQGGGLPIRRTYDVSHGYSPSGYYNYNTDYGDGGQSEEVLFREVLSGMPEGSRYTLSSSENTYPESQIYNSQDQVYDAMKGTTDNKYKNSDSYRFQDKKDTGYEQGSGNFEPNYPQDYASTYAMTYDTQEVLKTRDNSDKYPIYNREVTASYVYPESGAAEKNSRLNDDYGNGGKYVKTTEVESAPKYPSEKLSSKYSTSRTDTIERQPEALYRVAGDYDAAYRGDSTIKGVNNQHSWHRIGSAMDYRRSSHIEPGPRSLNLSKLEVPDATDATIKRTKRSVDSVIQRIGRKQRTGSTEKDIENEIDFDNEDEEDVKNSSAEATTISLDVSQATAEDVTNNTLNYTTTTEADYDVIETSPVAYNFLEVLKRLAQYKLKMGLSFLRSTTDAFSRYLDVIQKRVDESITNTTLVYRIRRDPRNEPKSRTKRRASDYGKRKQIKKQGKKTSLKKN